MFILNSPFATIRSSSFGASIHTHMCARRTKHTLLMTISLSLGPSYGERSLNALRMCNAVCFFSFWRVDVCLRHPKKVISTAIYVAHTSNSTTHTPSISVAQSDVCVYATQCRPSPRAPDTPARLRACLHSRWPAALLPAPASQPQKPRDVRDAPIQCNTHARLQTNRPNIIHCANRASPSTAADWPLATRGKFVR